MKYSILGELLLIVLVLSSCDVLNQDPVGVATGKEFIINEETARNALNGAYASLRSSGYVQILEAVLSTQSPYMEVYNPHYRVDFVEFDQHTFDAENSTILELWTNMYEMINSANNVIFYTEGLPTSKFSSESAKKEIIAEARFLRAFATFDLLRFYGQFYKNESKYGVSLRLKPATAERLFKTRASVQESYEAILNDLNYVIENGPDFSLSYRASKLSAKALKARVKLYQGKYQAAAVLADAVVNNPGRSLSESYAMAFDSELESTENIFVGYLDEKRGQHKYSYFRWAWYNDPYLVPSEQFINLAAGDPRADAILDTTETAADSTVTAITLSKFNSENKTMPIFFIRLPEMYLIKAEALARQNKISAGRAALNALRTGRPNTQVAPSSATTKEALLDDIYHDIAVELGFENGHAWFAMLRFSSYEVSMITSMDSTLRSENRFIWPIPVDEMIYNEELKLQNPGYK